MLLFIHSSTFLSGLESPRWHLVFHKDVQALCCPLQEMISLTVRWFQPSIHSRMEHLYVLYAENSKCIGRHAIFLNLMLLSSLGLIADIFIMFWLTYSINWPPSVQNATNQPRLSPPNSSSGRSTLPPAASWYGISKSLLLPFCYALKLRTVLLIFFPFLCAGGSVI